MAEAMKIHLKKNAAANGLVLMERLQGLTATDVTHSCDQRRLSLYSIYDLKNTVKIHLLNNKHSPLIKSRNKTGISAPSDLHSPVASL